MSEWQPIETAPRDGTPILIWDPTQDGVLSYKNDDGIDCAFDDHRYAIGYWRTWQDGSKYKWTWMWGNRNAVRVEPTHWMPLPAPPLSPQSGEPI